MVIVTVEKYTERINKLIFDVFSDDISFGLCKLLIDFEFPKYKKEIYLKLKDNIEELLGTFIKQEDHKKLLLETAIYVEKADITEEIVRLNNHIDKFSALLEEKTELGKKLNFILQEMHREINTIGSKFNSTKVFDDTILIKEEIEKCREIIQNVR